MPVSPAADCTTLFAFLIQGETAEARTPADTEEASDASCAATEKEDCEASSALESGMSWPTFHITISSNVVAASQKPCRP